MRNWKEHRKAEALFCVTGLIASLTPASQCTTLTRGNLLLQMCALWALQGAAKWEAPGYALCVPPRVSITPLAFLGLPPIGTSRAGPSSALLAEGSIC